MLEEVQTMVIKVRYWIDNSRKNQIKKAINIINSLQNYYYLVLEPTDSDVVDEESINWYFFLKYIR